MTIAETLLQELEQESHATRRVLERVPGDKLGFKPHEKSWTLGQLALHLAQLPGGIANLSAMSPAQAPQFNQGSCKTAAELVPAFEASIARAREVLGGATDAELMADWVLMDGDQEIWRVPRVALLRTLMLNHTYHHRGQLTVYLRELNVPVPSIYGPSADENPFAQPTQSAAKAAGAV
jgi:uncharacterized damage-inducible protein DinB